MCVKAFCVPCYLFIASKGREVSANGVFFEKIYLARFSRWGNKKPVRHNGRTGLGGNRNIAYHLNGIDASGDIITAI